MFKLLIVDDEPSVLDALKLMMNWDKLGFYICGEATNGEEAFNVIKEYSPDIVITDIKMPVLDGFQLIEKTEIFTVKPKFIVMSGFCDFEYARKAMRYGVADFLLKPIDEYEISETLLKIKLDLIDEYASREEMLDIVRRSARDCFLNIIYGGYREKLAEKLGFILNIENRKVKLLFVCIDNYFKLYNSVSQQDCSKILSSFLDHISKKICYENRVFYNESGNFVVFLSDDMKLFSENESVYLDIIDDLYEKTGLNVSFLFSGIIHTLTDLSKCMSHIEYLKQVYYYSPNAKIYVYENNNYEKFEHDFTELPYSAIADAIKLGSEKAVYSAIDEFFLVIYKNRPTNKLLTIYLHQLAGMIDKIGAMEGVRMDSEINTYIKSLDNGNFPTSKEAAYNMCISVYEKLHKYGEKPPADLEKDIIQFINKNYSEEMSLQTLSDEFSLNPLIISKMIKNHTGKKFNDYLNSIKIENAMKIIASTDMKILHVCELVGYKDYPYFVNKFKELAGVLPSEYKRSFI